MPADKHTNPRLAVQLLSKCYIPNVNINIEGSLDQFDDTIIKKYSLEANLKPGKAIGFFPTEENPIAKLYFKKPDTTKKFVVDKITEETRIEFKRANPNSYSIIVRLVVLKCLKYPYLIMCKVWVHFIIDLVSRRDIKPRDIFTDNRDSFKDDKINQAIQEFISDLQEKRERALIEQSKKFTQVFEGIGAFAPHRMQEKSKYRTGIARSTIKTKSVKDQVGNVKNSSGR